MWAATAGAAHRAAMREAGFEHPSASLCPAVSLWWIVDLFLLPTWPLLAVSMLTFKVGRLRGQQGKLDRALSHCRCSITSTHLKTAQPLVNAFAACVALRSTHGSLQELCSRALHPGVLPHPAAAAAGGAAQHQAAGSCSELSEVQHGGRRRLLSSENRERELGEQYGTGSGWYTPRGVERVERLSRQSGCCSAPAGDCPLPLPHLLRRRRFGKARRRITRRDRLS